MQSLQCSCMLANTPAQTTDSAAYPCLALTSTNAGLPFPHPLTRLITWLPNLTTHSDTPTEAVQPSKRLYMLHPQLKCIVAAAAAASLPCLQKLSFSIAEVRLVPAESIAAVEHSIAEFNKTQQDKVRGVTLCMWW